MTDMVLVHGAWGGSYGFNKVRPLLWDAGHQVFTPSLTGIGERSHLASPQVTLTTHIRDVVNTVLYEDLDDILLLGFSYGGMVVSGCLDHIGDRVRHLVYLDAFVPNDGDSINSRRGHPDPTAKTAQAWTVPPIPRELPDPVETAWNNARRSNQPIGTFTERVHLSKPLDQWDFSRTYIKASADPNEEPTSHFWEMARHAKESDDWAHHEIPTNHLVATTHPAEVTKILTDLVA